MQERWKCKISMWSMLTHFIIKERFERTLGQAYKHARGCMSILQKKWFNKSKSSNHYAVCIANKKKLEDAKATKKGATAKKEVEDSDGDAYFFSVCYKTYVLLGILCTYYHVISCSEQCKSSVLS